MNFEFFCLFVVGIGNMGGKNSYLLLINFTWARKTSRSTYPKAMQIDRLDRIRPQSEVHRPAREVGTPKPKYNVLFIFFHFYLHHTTL